MSIKYKRGSENEEMAKTFDFIQENKNALMMIIAAIALIIILFNWYRSNQAETMLLSADKNYEVYKAFSESDFAKVIDLGVKYVDKYSGYSAAEDMMIMVSKAYVEEGKKDEAINFLEANIGSNTNKSSIKFSAYNILAGLYIDKWYETKDENLAIKSAGYYEKAAVADNGFHKDKSNYLAAEAYIKAGKIEKAKNILKPMYEKNSELEYQLKLKVRYLYEGLN